MKLRRVVAVKYAKWTCSPWHLSGQVSMFDIRHRQTPRCKQSFSIHTKTARSGFSILLSILLSIHRPPTSMYLNLVCMLSLSAYASSSNSSALEVVDWRLTGRVFFVNENPNPWSAAKLSSCCILARRRALAIFSRAILFTSYTIFKRELKEISKITKSNKSHLKKECIWYRLAFLQEARALGCQMALCWGPAIWLYCIIYVIRFSVYIYAIWFNVHASTKQKNKRS